jgi:alkanesulfonate monooxygenase SsuD/methylene tetrahydromethanopterin reductase-like flavin-dependent oxidoreductase (luciferase family)
LPIVIGGNGPTRTLRTVARWADHWDSIASDPVQWARNAEVLAQHCAAIGREPAEIRRSVHLMWEADADPSELAERAALFGDAGVDLVIFSMRGPYEPRLLAPLADALRH